MSSRIHIEKLTQIHKGDRRKVLLWKYNKNNRQFGEIYASTHCGHKDAKGRKRVTILMKFLEGWNDRDTTHDRLAITFAFQF